MDRVFYECEQYKLPAPRLIASPDGMKVIIRGPCTFDQLSSEDRVNTCYWHCVLRYEVEREAMSVSSMRERFCFDAEVDMEQVYAVIKDTIARDLIVQVSENGNDSKYTPNWD